MAHVSSRRLFRALNIESNLARPVIFQIPTQSPGRYTAEMPLRRIKLFFIPSKFALCAKYSHIVDFLGSHFNWECIECLNIKICKCLVLNQTNVRHFQPLEVVGRDSDAQLQEGENLN